MNDLQKENTEAFKYLYRDREVLYKQLRSNLINKDTRMRLITRIEELSKEIKTNIPNSKLRSA